MTRDRSDRRGQARGRFVHAVGMTLVLGVLAGCALHASWGPHRPIGPRVTMYDPDTTGIYTDVPHDSLQKLLEQVTKDASAPRGAQQPASSQQEAPPVPDTAIPSDSLAGPSPDTLTTSPVSVALPEGERRELRRAALADLERVTTVVAAAEKQIVTEAETEQLRTIRGLIEQAQAALQREDIPAAANLAHKARLLGDELPPR